MFELRLGNKVLKAAHHCVVESIKVVLNKRWKLTGWVDVFRELIN